MSMTLVQTVTVGAGGAASIEFTGIPQDGTDLLVLLSGRTTRTGTADIIGAQFNNETATTNYSLIRLMGTGSSVTTSTSNPQSIGLVNANLSTASTFSNIGFYIPNYASNAQKSISSDSTLENNATAVENGIYAARWANTAAITSIKMLSLLGANNFEQHSTASLYKITKA